MLSKFEVLIGKVCKVCKHTADKTGFDEDELISEAGLFYSECLNSVNVNTMSDMKFLHLLSNRLREFIKNYSTLHVPSKDMYAVPKLEQLIKQLKEVLSDNELYAVVAESVFGLTYEEIGEELGISAEDAEELHKEAIEILEESYHSGDLLYYEKVV